MILIHTALQSEAQSIIEFYKLQKCNSIPKIYKNNSILVVISGIGKNNTIDALQFVFKEYNISKAINIGIAGCNNQSILIGSLFCTNHTLENVNYLPLITNNIVTIKSDEDKKYLYDMEGEYFYTICQDNLEEKNIIIFKVVSDYLDDIILAKEFVKQLIYKNIKSITKWI